jgi:hypothetical protein
VIFGLGVVVGADVVVVVEVVRGLGTFRLVQASVIPIKFNNKHKTSVDTMLNLQFLKLLK